MVTGMIATSGLYTKCCGQLQVPPRTQRLEKGQTGRIRVVLNSGRKSGVSSGRNMQQRTTECLLELWWRNKRCETFLSMVVNSVQFSSAAQSCLTLQPHGLQHARPPCPSATPRVYPNSCPLSPSCHPTISPSVVSLSSHLQSFPASGSFPMSSCFTSGGQSIRVSASASVLPMNIQDWFPLGLIGLLSLQS